MKIKNEKYIFYKIKNWNHGRWQYGAGHIKWINQIRKVPLDNIFISNRSEGKLNRIAEKFSVVSDQRATKSLWKSKYRGCWSKAAGFAFCFGTIRSAFTADHILVSLAAGISISTINKMLPQVHQIGPSNA